ncbi:MAG: flagellar hook-associated protein FlgL [Candidatus Thiodiazotropha taylori]|uniref:Flagellar hook-associated protein FlgL n=1 Tax=Candidatus Thiodiazotropha taylori TaxID=2792791 RepID=A0A9E4N3P7_9GAMM|nr:flagellar hook-associated protein FlgL [Candidatus Thiodiazotropha taylori]RLW54626.1 MAG: flagellar hook-associated protein 3 [gamma proteobacterium symbiont of Stewartia floridana]MCG7869441.1 flagellar hook-associated protein FlgL [Candidatus Thiodiazotropha taylori]MCG7892978.1 flagellar hook-associated protein FlgL [Candidatus Thiodiazotropha taylori]MCG7910120.1 flagellar hook-associated protein FlgL [Candidatus Thiodiazotropha taylori]
MERVSTSTLFSRGIDSMLERQSALSRAQLQISSGKRILTPRDDPPGAAQALNLKTSITQVEQYQANADRARARLDLQEASLAAVEDIMPRVLELTLQGQSDTYSAEQRIAIAQELRQLNDELMALANTQDSDGEYIFAGYSAESIPFSNPADGVFVYSGDMGVRTIQISATRQVQDRENGYDVFMNLTTSTGAQRNLFETVHGIIAGLEADAPNAVFIDDIHAAHEQIGAVRARGGARLNTIEDQGRVNEDFIFTMQSSLSDIEDIDLAEAVSRFEQEMLALQAAQQSFNMVQSLSLFNYL